MLLEVGEAFNMFVQMMNNNYPWRTLENLRT